MDQVIEAARQLGKTLQADERYIRYRTAQQQNDEDQGLQDLIAAFNKKRMELNTEIQKKDKDQEQIKAMDTEMKSLYNDIFANENMARFTELRGEVETLVNFINQIITGATSGLDPDTIEYQESCGGSCSSCSGCS